MLCYRFMLSSKISSSSSYLKLYDSEIVPLLLRRPAPTTATASLYSTLECSSSAANGKKSVSLSRHHREQEFIRSSRSLFHTTAIQCLKEKKPTGEQSSTSGSETAKTDEVAEQKAEVPILDQKLGLFARFKKMYKEYWYVLLPVHVVTSAGWLGGFYYLSLSGFDVATLMESWHFNDMIVSHLRDSKLGHVAIAYFLYKCFTPIRYMVTLGGTTLAIKNLSRLGYIRPVPTKDAFMKMYQDRKDSAKQAIQKKTHGGSNSL